MGKSLCPGDDFPAPDISVCLRFFCWPGKKVEHQNMWQGFKSLSLEDESYQELDKIDQLMSRKDLLSR